MAITHILERLLLNGQAKNKIHHIAFGSFSQIQIPPDSFIVIHKIYWNGFFNQKPKDVGTQTWKEFFKYNEYQLKVQSDKENPIYYILRNEINFLNFGCCDAPPAPAIGTAGVRFNDGEGGNTYTFNFNFLPLGNFFADVNITNLAISVANIQAQLTLFQPGWIVTGTTDFIGNQFFTFTTTTPGTAFNNIPIIISSTGIVPPPGFVSTPGKLSGGSNGITGKAIILNEPINIDQFNSSILITPKKPVIFDTFITAYDYLNFTISRNELLANASNYIPVNQFANEKNVPDGVNGQNVLITADLVGTNGTVTNYNPVSAKDTPIAITLQPRNTENYHQDLDQETPTDNGSFIDNPIGGVKLNNSEYVTNPLISLEYCLVQKNVLNSLSPL